jgi:hypothetical protein
MKRKIIFKVFVFMLLLLTVYACKNDFRMNRTELVEYLGNKANVIIPEGVTAIGDEAFINNKKLESVVIPSGVISIGNRAFRGCTSLTSVVIPSSVISIGGGAFSYSSLISITIPSSVTSIGKEAFSYSGIISVIIPESVTSIGELAFYGCNNLKTVVVSSGTGIGVGAFPAAAQITYSDLLPEKSETQIDSIPLSDDDFEIDGTELVEYLGEEAKVIIPAGVTSIRKGAFYGPRISRLVTSITIPSSVTSIVEGILWLRQPYKHNGGRSEQNVFKCRRGSV